MPQPKDLSRSLIALDRNSTIISVVELSQSSRLVAGMLPGIERQPRKKLEPSQNGCLPCCIAGCSATWRGRASSSARSGISRTLVRNDYSSSLRLGLTRWFGGWAELSVGSQLPHPAPMTWLGAMSFSTQLTRASKSKSLLWHTPVMSK